MERKGREGRRTERGWCTSPSESEHGNGQDGAEGSSERQVAEGEESACYGAGC